MHPLSHVPKEMRQAARLKFAILASGLRLTQNASRSLFGGTGELGPAKRPIRTRSGVSGGLDLQLSDTIFVNAPVLEPFALTSDLQLETAGRDLVVINATGEALGFVHPLREPAFYGRRTADESESMARIGQMCSPDRFCYGMTGPGCSFWPRHERCRYCSIGLNAPADASHKREHQLYEVLEAAMAEPEWPARHVLLGGGTPPGPDMGASLAARLCIGIKKRFDVSVYVMIAAPLDDQYIDLLYDAGVDELGMNLEFWSDYAWDMYIPGKRDRIGKTRYLQALEYAFNLFGSVRTRSIFIVGLEPAEQTLLGVGAVASLGVMPILSPFRPLSGTQLAETKGFDAEVYTDLYDEANQLATGLGLPLGPTCICCQNNVLALPVGSEYRWYGLEATPVRDPRRL